MTRMMTVLCVFFCALFCLGGCSQGRGQSLTTDFAADFTADYRGMTLEGKLTYTRQESLNLTVRSPGTLDGVTVGYRGGELTLGRDSLRCTADDFVSLRTGPDAGYSEIVKIPRGYTMTFLEESSNGWYHVRYGSYTGYVYSAYVEFI